MSSILTSSFLLLLVSIYLLTCFPYTPKAEEQFERNVMTSDGGDPKQPPNSTTSLPLDRLTRLDFKYTCLAARMDYWGRYPYVALYPYLFDPVEEYERRGFGIGQTWNFNLCEVNPVYINDSICVSCGEASRIYYLDNIGSLYDNGSSAYPYYLERLAGTAKAWHCEKCLPNNANTCWSARSEYLRRYELKEIDAVYHYYTYGISRNYTWNSSLCTVPASTEPDSPVCDCSAAATWYAAKHPLLFYEGFYPARVHYKRYALEFGAYWNCDLCIDVENECQSGNNTCGPNSICNNTVGPIGSYSCTCKTGYVGSADGRNCTDYNECTGDNPPCDVNANCTNTIGSYNCTCKAGLRGDGATCSDINECEEKRDLCHEQAACKNTFGSYACECNPPYEGDGQNCTLPIPCEYPSMLCGDGKCISNLGFCAPAQTCTAPTPYKCVTNGTCASSVETCAYKPPGAQCTTKYQCWDGACVNNMKDCAILPECPPYQRRCQSGECKAACSDTECNPDLQEICDDGLCALKGYCAVNWNGCPLGLPYLCPNGTCAANWSFCGACMDCSRIARTLRIPTVSVRIPVGAKDITMPGDFIPTFFFTEKAPQVVMAKLTFSTAFFNTSSAIINATSLPDSIAFKAGEPIWGRYFEPNSKILSTPFEVKMYGGANPWPSTVQIDLSYFPADKNVTDYCLGIINETSGMWECESPIVRNALFVTAFVNRLGKMAVIQNPPASAITKNNYDDRVRSMGIYLVALFVSLYCVGLIFASLRDRKIFIQIVAEKIRRESNAHRLSDSIPAPAIGEVHVRTRRDTEAEMLRAMELEKIKRENAKRGLSMPNIIVSDEVRARHIKKVQVGPPISTPFSSISSPFTPVPTLSIPFSSINLPQEAEVTGNRTERAMTFDIPRERHVLFAETPTTIPSSPFPTPTSNPSSINSSISSSTTPATSKTFKSSSRSPSKATLGLPSSIHPAPASILAPPPTIAPSPASLSSSNSSDTSSTSSTSATTTNESVPPYVVVATSTSPSASYVVVSAPVAANNTPPSTPTSTPTISSSAPPKTSELSLSLPSPSLSSSIIPPPTPSPSAIHVSPFNALMSSPPQPQSALRTPRGLSSRDSAFALHASIPASDASISPRRMTMSVHERSPTTPRKGTLDKSVELSDLPRRQPSVRDLHMMEGMEKEKERGIEKEIDKDDLERLSLSRMMLERHTWISPAFTTKNSRLTCVEQLTLLFCTILLNLGFSAAFYDGSTDSNISQCITIAISSASLVLFITLGLALLFQNTKVTILKIIVFGITFMFCALGIILTMVFSWEFVGEVTVLWVISFLIASVQDFFVNQPFKVLLISLLFGCLPSDHWLILLL